MEIKLNKILITILLLAGLSLQAQELFYRKNLANIDVNKITQQEIKRFQTQIVKSNMSESEVISYLMGKGLSRSDISDLLKRMDSPTATPFTSNSNTTKENQTENPDPLVNRMYVKRKMPPDSMVFGAELFYNTKPDYTPNLQLATPVNYILGPGDQINLTLFGNQEVVSDQLIDPNGRVTLPYAGVVLLGGMTVDQAENNLRKIFRAKGFEALENGDTRLTLSIKQYRSIPVLVIGAKFPGKYMVPSVASAFHALIQAGGPNARGSFRSIEVIRHGKVVQNIDLYRFIINGDRSTDIQLEENDVINIPVTDRIVRLRGEVKHPGFFELTGTENLDTLLSYSGGFTPLAYKDNIFVEQVGTNEIRTRDILASEFSAYQPANGDVFTIGSISEKYYNRVFLAGAVNRPGTYGWEDGLTLATLLGRAGGLDESALLSRGIIYRSGKNHENEYLRFVPKEISEGKTDLKLMDGDSIVLGDRKQMFPYETVQVVGEVNKEDAYTWGEGMTALDAIMMAGGIKRSAKSSQIVITRKNTNQGENVVAQTITSPSDAELMIRAEEVILQPKDVIIVRPDPDYFNLQLVKIEGEIKYPGSYVLLEKNERLSSLLKRAGGLTSLGDPNGVLIIRQKTNMVASKRMKKIIHETDTNLIRLDSLMQKKSAINEKEEDDPDYIAINNINLLMNQAGGKYDINLQEDDHIMVLMFTNTVTVRGKVNNEVIVNYMGKRLKQYLSEAGGTPKGAQKSRIYVIEPNGRAMMTRQWMGIRKYPHLVPGSIVVVPEKEKSKDKINSPATWAGVASILASASSLLILISTLK